MAARACFLLGNENRKLSDCVRDDFDPKNVKYNRSLVSEEVTIFRQRDCLRAIESK